MATERQSPDAIAAQSGFGSCAVTDIDDDPDSPDALWCVASSNGANTDVRVTFPTPTGDPTVGVDLQEFRAQVRQFDTGQGGDPDARIELWEDGVLVRAGSDVPVTGAGQVIAFSWNANELATADGSLVELKVVGTKSGGSPGNRNAVDVGAVEWNVDYTTGPTIVEGAATLAGTGALTAAALLQVPAAAALSGSGTLAGSGFGITSGAAALSGAGDLVASGLAVVSGAAAVSGAGALTGTGKVLVDGAASLSGGGALSASPLVIVFGVAALSGIGSLSGQALQIALAAVSLDGQGSLVGDGVVVGEEGPPAPEDSATFGTAIIVGPMKITSY